MTRTLARRATLSLAALALTLGPAAPAHTSETLPPGAGSVAGPRTGTGRKVIGDGHVDLGPRFDGGTWTVQIRDDTTRPATWRDTSDVVLQVKDTARTQVPEGKTFTFLGDPGDDVWLLPQAQRDGVLWPGWNSQDPEVVARVGREVNWQLTGAQGPGDFVLFLNGSFGTPKVVFDSRRKAPQETGIEINSHVHGNWAFTEPGTYLLGIRMYAETKDGERHDSRRTLRFSVGPRNPGQAFAARPTDDHGPAGDGTDQQANPGGSPAALWWGGGAAVAVAAAAVALVRRRGRRDTGSSAATERSEGTSDD